MYGALDGGPVDAVECILYVRHEDRAIGRGFLFACFSRELYYFGLSLTYENMLNLINDYRGSNVAGSCPVTVAIWCFGDRQHKNIVSIKYLLNVYV